MAEVAVIRKYLGPGPNGTRRLKACLFLLLKFPYQLLGVHLSELHNRTIGHVLKAVSALSVAADINIVMRFQPPSLDRIFHLRHLDQNGSRHSERV
jgi:hypothetical protein